MSDQTLIKTLTEELTQLKQQNSKLKKINNALMQRVEESGENQYAPYTAFEHSIHLAEQVREKTQTLNETLTKLERANHALKQANEKTNLFQQRFIDAIESISEAFVLLDEKGRILLQNSNFANFWANSGLPIKAGANLNDLKDLAKTRGIIQRASPGDAFASPVYQLSDERWFQLNEHRTSEGGWVMLYTDITAVKNAESARYERGMAQKSLLLQNLIDNLSQGVILISSYNKIEVWNMPFARISQLSPHLLRSMPNTKHLTHLTELNLTAKSTTDHACYIQTLANGTVLEIREHRLNNAKTIKTFSDITERRKNALALQKAHDLLELRVEERTAQLQNLNNTLQIEVEERRQAQENLLKAKSEAEFANSSKTKFLAAVSHDLLQPLNAAQLFTSSLIDTQLEGKTKKLLGCVTNSLDDLENLICTLVDISKLDAGVVNADKCSFKLSELLDNLASEYQQISQQFNVELRYVSSDIVINSDSVLLARILRNFLSNAFRYTNNGKVLLGCRRQGNQVLIEVWDNGMGIAKDQTQEIFKEFKRLKPSQTAFRNGLGLGLAIVDKISKVLKHPIMVNSTLNKGSVFSVKVPLGKLNQVLTSNNSASFMQTTSLLTHCEIWLIDNDATVCAGMSQLLKGWGCLVTTATSLENLQQRVNIYHDRADVLIVDYHLDDNINGLDVANQINKCRTQALPVMMITANYSKELKKEVFSKNILLLNKPVKPMKLKTSLLYLLQ